jgi:predicted RNase H-like nuclease (RuvC/YqgF family)
MRLTVMARPALLLEWENPVEERVTRLEEKVDRLQSDVSEIRTDLRRLDGKLDDVDKRLSAKIDDVDKRLSAKIDAGNNAVNALALGMEKSFGELKVSRALDRVWWLVMWGTMLGIMARALKWI